MTKVNLFTGKVSYEKAAEILWQHDPRKMRGDKGNTTTSHKRKKFM